MTITHSPATSTVTPEAPAPPTRFRLRDLPAKLRPADPVALRLAALRRFAVAITILNILGHLFFGFEQSLAQVVVTVPTCYLAEVLFETLVARRDGRRPGYLCTSENATTRQRVLTVVNFLLPAHITGFALAMLLFISDRIDLFIVIAIVSIGSKYVLRVRTPQGEKHFFNPSNLGITIGLLAFADTVSIAPPYQFTEGLDAVGDVALPVILACLGLFINFIFTGKLPLIMAWVGGFIAQAVIRGLFFDDVSVAAAVAPLTGMAILLFTLYMITDPGTTPRSTRAQIIFGLSVAGVYGALMCFHIAFGVFFALTLVCAARGIILWASNRYSDVAARRRESSPNSTPSMHLTGKG